MYCQNCGHEIPDHAKFCEYCGAPVGGRPDDTVNNSGNDDLKFKENMVSRDGRRIPGGDYEDHRRAEKRKSARKGSRGLFIVLCIAIVALSAGIAWEVLTLVSINQSASHFTLPKLQTESTITEAGSSAESAEPAE